MYVLVRPSGTLTFQLDYRMNGRRETVTFGKYGPAGVSLARALELCIDAKRAIREGRSPAIETFNRVTYAVVAQAKREGLPLGPFTVHDLRRTGSTLLNELGFNNDWIEKCLAHESGRSSRGVYNKAEYEVQRRHMMQEWSDIIDAWVEDKKHVPALIPPSMPLLQLDSALSPVGYGVA